MKTDEKRETVIDSYVLAYSISKIHVLFHTSAGNFPTNLILTSPDNWPLAMTNSWRQMRVQRTNVDMTVQTAVYTMLAQLYNCDDRLSFFET